MTTDREVLARIDAEIYFLEGEIYKREGFGNQCVWIKQLSAWKALRAVVELHKEVITPNSSGGMVSYCSACLKGSPSLSDFPCTELQAIAKELG